MWKISLKHTIICCYARLIVPLTWWRSLYWSYYWWNSKMWDASLSEIAAGRLQDSFLSVLGLIGFKKRRNKDPGGGWCDRKSALLLVSDQIYSRTFINKLQKIQQKRNFWMMTVWRTRRSMTLQLQLQISTLWFQVGHISSSIHPRHTPDQQFITWSLHFHLRKYLKCLSKIVLFSVCSWYCLQFKNLGQWIILILILEQINEPVTLKYKHMKEPQKSISNF